MFLRYEKQKREMKWGEVFGRWNRMYQNARVRRDPQSVAGDDVDIGFG